MLASIGGGSASGLASRVLGSNSGANNDPYQEYLQLLPSSRLSKSLIERNHILQMLFSGDWDEGTKTWKQPSTFRAALRTVKQVLNRPVNYPPGVDDVTLFLQRHLSLTHASAGSSLSLLPEATSYMSVSFTYSDPKQAEALLNSILLETDRIIREDQRHDVTARISFLRQELSRESIAADERTALISILSAQEQLLAMVQADNRYALTLVVPPYASQIPTSPPGPVKMVLYVLVISFVVWFGLMIVSVRFAFIRKLVAYFEPSKRTRSVD